MRSPLSLSLPGPWLACALAIILVVLSAGQGGAPARAQEQEAGYRVSVGDVLSITVYGDAGLSGQFPVAPDGTIAYPVLGNVPVVGLTPARVGEQIDKDLSQHIPGLAVTASILQYAAVFVVGDVNTPGRYEYRPGMIALELVALGGGIRRATAAPQGAQVQLIAARQDYADLELQVFSQEIVRDRLRAELEEREYDPEPVEELDPGLRAVRERMVEGERRLFAMRGTALETEDEALLAQEKSYDDEIAKVTASIELHSQEIALLMEDVASQRALVERGLTAKSSLREAERNLSATRRDALELGSYLARAQQNKLAIQQRRLALSETRRNEAAAQLQEIDLNLARMRARQRSLLDTMSELALQAGTDPLEAANVRPEFDILRMVDGEYQEAAAAERDSLRPGDILKVTIPLMSRPRSASLE